MYKISKVKWILVDLKKGKKIRLLWNKFRHCYSLKKKKSEFIKIINYENIYLLVIGNSVKQISISVNWCKILVSMHYNWWVFFACIFNNFQLLRSFLLAASIKNFTWILLKCIWTKNIEYFFYEITFLVWSLRSDFRQFFALLISSAWILELFYE